MDIIDLIGNVVFFGIIAMLFLLNMLIEKEH